MDQSVLLSVIVPAYNLEDYIDACVRSVLEQSFSEYELILVNDGSSDSTGERCSRLQKEYPDRIRYFFEENAGVSAARNRGLAEVVGQYVMFVDGDDLLYPGILGAVADVIEKECPDLLYFDYSRGDPDPPELLPRVIRTDYLIETRTGSAENRLGGRTIPCTGCCYRKTLLDNNGIRFDTEQFYVEDALFFFQALTHADKIIYHHVCGYYYRQRKNSATHLSEFTVKTSENQLLGWKKIKEYIPQTKKAIRLYRRWLRKTQHRLMKKKIRKWISRII